MIPYGGIDTTCIVIDDVVSLYASFGDFDLWSMISCVMSQSISTPSTPHLPISGPNHPSENFVFPKRSFGQKNP